ncbi:MAG: hypothetical protein ACR2NA_05565, partial [Solirubrobacterales bacterium]
AAAGASPARATARTAPSPRPPAVPGRAAGARLRAVVPAVTVPSPRAISVGIPPLRLPRIGGLPGAIRGMPDTSLVCRLTQTRLWIAVFGLLLAGIVAVNVATLSLSAGAGKATQEIEALRGHTSELRARLASKTSLSELESSAAEIGMVVPQISDIRYLGTRAGDADAKRAASRLDEISPNPPAPAIPAPAAEQPGGVTPGEPGAPAAEPAPTPGAQAAPSTPPAATQSPVNPTPAPPASAP